MDLFHHWGAFLCLLPSNGRWILWKISTYVYIYAYLEHMLCTDKGLTVKMLRDQINVFSKTSTGNGLKWAEWARAFGFQARPFKTKVHCFSWKFSRPNKVVGLEDDPYEGFPIPRSISVNTVSSSCRHNEFCTGHLTCLCHLWLTQTTLSFALFVVVEQKCQAAKHKQ